MYFITTKRMLEVCFSAHPNIQYRTKKCNILTGGYQPNSCLINKVETYRWDQKARTDAEDSHGSGSFLIIYFSFPGL